MRCVCCGSKMEKFKYLHYEELEDYLLREFQERDSQQYEDWLRSLDKDDVVLTLFQREDGREMKKHYYCRVVEKKTKTGIKLRGLSRVFKFTSGEIVYRNEIITTTYRICPINQAADKVIRDYCGSVEEALFDIDRLNGLLTSTLLQKI